MKIRIFNIQRFCVHDGPGVRTTVFFAGCPLKCRWCHNPEGMTAECRIFFHAEKCISCGQCLDTDCGAQVFEPSRYIDRERCISCGNCASLCPSKALERSAYEMESEDIMTAVGRDMPFYGTLGGITLSGGEPMLQADAALELLRAAKADGINTALETSGMFAEKYLPQLAETVDLFLWDYKDSNPLRFRENTGGDLNMIENNLRLADSLGAKIRLRCILIHGINTDRVHAEKIKELAGTIKNLDGIDLIKYHPMGQSKYEQLGIPDTFNGRDKIPTEEEMNLFRSVLSSWL